MKIPFVRNFFSVAVLVKNRPEWLFLFRKADMQKKFVMKEMSIEGSEISDK